MEAICPKCNRAFLEGDQVVIYKNAMYCNTCKDAVENEDNFKRAFEDIDLPVNIIEELQVEYDDDDILGAVKEPYCLIYYQQHSDSQYSYGLESYYTKPDMIKNIVEVIIPEFHDDESFKILYILKDGVKCPFKINLEVSIGTGTGHVLDFGKNEY